MGGSATTTQTSQSNNKSQFTPDPAVMAQWQNVTGAAQGLTNYMMNNSVYPGDQVAAPTDLTNQYWQNAGAQTQAPGMAGFQRGMTDIGSASINQYRDPNQINLPSNFNFQPGAIDFNNPYAGGVPMASLPGGVSGLASSYAMNPMMVSGPTVTAQNVSAPQGIGMIGRNDLMMVGGPNLQNYQMGPNQMVSAPSLRDFQMQAAANVAPQGQVTTQSWADPAAQQGLMTPYMQDVVDVQKQKAVQDYNQQLETTRAQAAAAGAYGGTRQAVQEATGQRDLALQLGQIQAQGTQQAYQQAQAQFNQQQQAQQQAQQFNIQAGLQAALANQANQQQANVQNLSSFLQTQGLGAQTGMQAGLANQATGLAANQANLQALLQTQGLGASLGQQAQLANQGQVWNMLAANQAGQQFNNTQQLQASLANQAANLQAAQATAGYNMQGQLANQAVDYQSQLAARQMGLQGALANLQSGTQIGLANQAAQMQALGQQYAGGLQGALQTQNLGMQGQVQGAQLGLQGAQQQEALRQAQQAANLQGFGQAANIYGQAGQLGLQGFNANLQGQQALANAAQSQQGYMQQRADQAYQNWLMSNMLPFQANAYNAQLLSMQPLPYTQTSSGTSTGTMTQPGPGIGGILGGFLGGLGSLAKGFGWRRGGAVHDDAAEDRAQILKILREKGLGKAGGGLAAARQLKRYAHA